LNKSPDTSLSNIYASALSGGKAPIKHGQTKLLKFSYAIDTVNRFRKPVAERYNARITYEARVNEVRAGLSQVHPLVGISS